MSDFIKLFLISIGLLLSHPYFAPFENLSFSPLFQLFSLAALFRLSQKKSQVQGSLYWAFCFFVMYFVFLRWMGLSPYLAPWGILGQFLAALILSAAIGGWYYLSYKYVVLAKSWAIVTFSLLWGLIEWSRQFWFCGFPWYTLSFAWVDLDMGSCLLGLLGPFWTSSLVLGSSFILSVARQRKIHLVLSAGTTAIFLLLGALFSSPYVVEAEVACLHTDMPLHYFSGSWNRFDVWSRLFQESPKWKKTPWQSLRLCLTHEGLLPDGLGGVKDVITSPSLAQKLAKMWNCYLVMGIEDDGADLGVANAVGIWKPSGELEGYYHKQVLVPFAEYFPMMDWPVIGPWFRDLSKSYGILEPITPGKASGLYKIQKIPVLFSICFEETFPSIVAKEARRGAMLWLSASNDGWFPDSSLAFDHYLHARLVSASTGLCLVRSSQKGYSAVLNGWGRAVGPVLKPQDSWQWKVEDKLIGRKTLYGSIDEAYGLIFAFLFLIMTWVKPGIWNLRRKAIGS